MLKENEYIRGIANVLADMAVAALALVLAHAVRNYVLAAYLLPEVFRYQSKFQDYWWLVFFLPLLTVAFLYFIGHYRSVRTRNWGSVLAAYCMATIGAALAAAVVSFTFTPRGEGGGNLSHIFSEEFVSRGILLLYVPLAVSLLGIKQIAARHLLKDLRYRGLSVQNMLLVGDPDAAKKFAAFVRQHPWWGFQIVGVITNTSAPGSIASPSEELPVVGHYADFLPYLDNHVVDDVVFVGSGDSLHVLEPLFHACEEMGIRARLPIQLGNRIARASLDTFDELPVITFDPVREYGPALFIKYASDRILAFLALLILSPIILLIMLLIKLTGNPGDPIFFGQTRCSLHGRQFTMWKFRSMVPAADDQRQSLSAHNEMSGPVFKIKNDPRITPVGKWLRRTSLDELPQLWNVLLGQMSLVGPRPPLPTEVAKYDRWQRRRLSMKPGMTCIWQVSGRNHVSFEDWMAMDLEYIDNWSLALDFRILVKTAYVVATGYGAM